MLHCVTSVSVCKRYAVAVAPLAAAVRCPVSRRGADKRLPRPAYSIDHTTALLILLFILLRCCMIAGRNVLSDRGGHSPLYTVAQCIRCNRSATADTKKW
jgi:hypothetical protein